MHIWDALKLGKECGLKTVIEALYNVQLHSSSLFTYEQIDRELEQLWHEWMTIARNSDFTRSSRITKVMKWMDRDRMCYRDELGGFHMGGIGTNPKGYNCGECSNLSCFGCPSVNKEKE